MNIDDFFIFYPLWSWNRGLMRECPSMSCVCPGPLLGGLSWCEHGNVFSRVCGQAISGWDVGTETERLELELGLRCESKLALPPVNAHSPLAALGPLTRRGQWWTRRGRVVCPPGTGRSGADRPQTAGHAASSVPSAQVAAPVAPTLFGRSLGPELPRPARPVTAPRLRQPSLCGAVPQGAQGRWGCSACTRWTLSETGTATDMLPKWGPPMATQTVP